MGVFRPPWVSKEWFAKCPFNYCDHYYTLAYEELGCEEYDVCFGERIKKKTIPPPH